MLNIQFPDKLSEVLLQNILALKPGLKFAHLFIHSFYKCLWSNYYISEVVVGLVGL